MEMSLFQERGVPYHMLKRIDTGTPDGDAIGFSDALFSGWLEIYDDCPALPPLPHLTIQERRQYPVPYPAVAAGWVRYPDRYAVTNHAAYHPQVRV